MKERLSEIILELEKRYSAATGGDLSVMHSPGGKAYYLNSIEKSIFNLYDPWEQKEDFKVAAVDGGSLMIYETPTWSLAYYKLAFRLFNANIEKKTCNTVQERQIIKHDIALFKTREQIKEFENGNFLKRKEEQFILEQIRNGSIDADTLLLVDGTLGPESTKIINEHRHTLGISKKTMFTIGRYSAVALLRKMAKSYSIENQPWFCYPLVKSYPEGEISEIMFGTFKGRSNIFRIDVPKNKDINDLRKDMEKLGLCSLDSKYSGYPYPLGAVHSDAVMRTDDKEKLKRFIKKEISKKDGDAIKMLRQDLADADWYDTMREKS